MKSNQGTHVVERVLEVFPTAAVGRVQLELDVERVAKPGVDEHEDLPPPAQAELQCDGESVQRRVRSEMASASLTSRKHENPHPPPQARGTVRFLFLPVTRKSLSDPVGGSG